MPQTVAELCDLLDLEVIDDNLFRGRQEDSLLPRVFGGQVAAQAAVAASRTVDSAYVLHSLHGYFLQPGDTNAPIVYDVDAVRDGRSFATRRVLARQHGRPIFTMTADYHRPESGRDHQEPMPDGVPAPDECPDPRRGTLDEWSALDFRIAVAPEDNADPAHVGRQAWWFRASSSLPQDPLIHQAVLTYASDMMLMGAALAPHGLRFEDGRTMVASLDHAVWFHQPFRVDEWWLFDQVSPAGFGSRSLVNARIFTPDGRLVASVAQEALLRPIGES